MPLYRAEPRDGGGGGVTEEMKPDGQEFAEGREESISLEVETTIT